MRFKLENSFSAFNFKDATLLSWEQNENNVTMLLSGMIAVANNPCNEERVDRYVDDLQLRMLNCKIVRMLLEGYKYYDANDVLQEEVPDKEIPVMDYPKIMKECAGQGFLFQIEEESENDETVFHFSIDVEEKTYLVTMQMDKSIMEWERFMNRA